MIRRITGKASPYLLFLLLGALCFPSSGTDDAYFTYWSAYALSEFGEIVNYNGDRVEQSSSLLHVIALASLHVLSGLNLVVLGKLFSVLMGAVCIHLAGRVAEELGIDATLGRLFVATAGPFLYWSFGGLETTAVGAALTWIVASMARCRSRGSTSALLGAGTGVVAYVTLRPEAVFVLGLWFALIFTALKLRGRRTQHVVLLAAIGLTSFVLTTLFRYSYFGAFFPQPVEAKIGPNLFEKLSWGMDYYLWSVREYPLLLVLGLAVVYLVIVHRKSVSRDEYLVPFGLVLSYSAFVLAAGGDWMEGGRFFVPLIPVLAVLLVDALTRLGRVRAMWILVPLNIVATVYFVANFSASVTLFEYGEYRRALPEADRFSFFEVANRWHYVKLPVVAEMDRILTEAKAAGASPVVMSIEAGIVPFHLAKSHFKEFQFVDLVGVSTRDFTRCDLSASGPRRQFGIEIGYPAFLRDADRFEERCGIERPDVIYDIIYAPGESGEKPAIVKEIESYGYHAAYIQERLIRDEGWFLVEQPHYVMIKSDLAELLDVGTTSYRK